MQRSNVTTRRRNSSRLAFEQVQGVAAEAPAQRHDRSLRAALREGGEDWLGDSLKPGKHTLVFDFKLAEPGLGKGGTGVLSVDGRELSRKTVEHTVPVMMTMDESFHIGSDTRTGVDDSYKLPFRFTGTIDKLTFKLGPEQISAEERKVVEHILAAAHD